MKIRKIDIQSIGDFKIGNSENLDKGTGCTVIICEKGAVGGVDVRGGAPATRETDLLKSENTIDAVNAVVLSGGSAFGLEAASGVMRELADRDIGFDSGYGRVPIVCGASLFDLSVGDSKTYPDIEMGINATRNAYEGKFDHGNRGAGTGASVGKFCGMNRAMKSGLGTFACADDYVQVGAVVAVNAMGDIYNGAGNIIAGLRSEDGKEIYGSIKSLKPMVHKMQETSAPQMEALSNFSIEERQRNKDEIADAIRNAFSNKIKEEAIKEKSKQETEEEAAAQQEASEPVNDVESLADFYTSDDMMVTGRFPRFTEIVEQMPEEENETEAETVVEVTAKPEPVPVVEERKEPEAAPAVVEKPNPVPEPVVEETAKPEPEPQEEPAPQPVFEDDDDQGYDIAFNTTVACLITNAKMTKSQANKLASILHDAYARAIKPVHSTMDGDTIFVLTSSTQEVNFDAFAALSTDVLQYAIIDAATSAKSAYGLPAACDIIK